MAIQAGTVLSFSITSLTGLADEAYGLCQSYGVTESTERAEARGPDGDVYSIQEFNDLKNLALDYLTKATPADAPVVGTVLSNLGDGITWYVNDSNAVETVDGFTSVSVSATSYPNLYVAP